MARNVTLTALRDDIEAQADFVGATQRYADSLTNRWINQAIQRFREKLSSEGIQHYLTYATGTLTAGATSPFAFKELDLSAVSPSVVRTYGVDITLASGRVISLTHTPFAERNSFGGPTVRSVPNAWMHHGTRKIAILPPPDTSYTYVVWYLPVLADLSSDADTFDGVSGWEEFIVWDVVARHMIRDRESESYAMADAYRREIWADILRNATRITHAGGAVIGRDSMGERGNVNARARRGWLPPP